jgi:hypothetical protein
MGWDGGGHHPAEVMELCNVTAANGCAIARQLSDIVRHRRRSAFHSIVCSAMASSNAFSLQTLLSVGDEACQPPIAR